MDAPVASRHLIYLYVALYSGEEKEHEHKEKKKNIVFWVFLLQKKTVIVWDDVFGFASPRSMAQSA